MSERIKLRLFQKRGLFQEFDSGQCGADREPAAQIRAIKTRYEPTSRRSAGEASFGQ